MTRFRVVELAPNAGRHRTVSIAGPSDANSLNMMEIARELAAAGELDAASILDALANVPSMHAWFPDVFDPRDEGGGFGAVPGFQPGVTAHHSLPSTEIQQVPDWLFSLPSGPGTPLGWVTTDTRRPTFEEVFGRSRQGTVTQVGGQYGQAFGSAASQAIAQNPPPPLPPAADVLRQFSPPIPDPPPNPYDDPIPEPPTTSRPIRKAGIPATPRWPARFSPRTSWPRSVGDAAEEPPSGPAVSRTPSPVRSATAARCAMEAGPMASLTSRSGEPSNSRACRSPAAIRFGIPAVHAPIRWAISGPRLSANYREGSFRSSSATARRRSQAAR